MRIISVALMVVSVALAGCQGGERISKAASVPQPAVGQPSVIEAGTPSGGSKCMEKCQAKADYKQAKCMETKAADVCDAAQLEAMLQCKDACPP